LHESSGFSAFHHLAKVDVDPFTVASVARARSAWSDAGEAYFETYGIRPLDEEGIERIEAVGVLTASER
jgi:hypothetical protein